MKKVLHIIPGTDFGGITTLMLDILKSIDKEAYEFHFIAFTKGELHDEFIENGAKLYYMDYISEQGISKYMKSLKKIMKEHKFSAIHEHTGYRGVFSLIVAKKQKIKKRILHSHTSGAEQWGNRLLLYSLKKISSRLATTLIACSKEAGDFCFGNLNYYIINNPINLKKIKLLSKDEKSVFREEINISNESLVIGHVGRFVEVKNHIFLIELAQELRQKQINFKLVLIGTGPMKKDIELLVESKQLRENICFLGERKDVISIAQIFNYFLLPSHYEGFPIVLLESQALNIKALVSEVVTKEVDLDLNLLKYISLEKELWVNEMLAWKSSAKEEHIHEEIIKRGFDSDSVATRLCDFY